MFETAEGGSRDRGKHLYQSFSSFSINDVLGVIVISSLWRQFVHGFHPSQCPLPHRALIIYWIIYRKTQTIRQRQHKKSNSLIILFIKFLPFRGSFCAGKNELGQTTRRSMKWEESARKTKDFLYLISHEAVIKMTFILCWEIHKSRTPPAWRVGLIAIVSLDEWMEQKHGSAFTAWGLIGASVSSMFKQFDFFFFFFIIFDLPLQMLHCFSDLLD